MRKLIVPIFLIVVTCKTTFAIKPSCENTVQNLHPNIAVSQGRVEDFSRDNEKFVDALRAADWNSVLSYFHQWAVQAENGKVAPWWKAGKEGDYEIHWIVFTNFIRFMKGTSLATSSMQRTYDYAFEMMLPASYSLPEVDYGMWKDRLELTPHGRDHLVAMIKFLMERKEFSPMRDPLLRTLNKLQEMSPRHYNYPDYRAWIFNVESFATIFWVTSPPQIAKLREILAQKNSLPIEPVQFSAEERRALRKAGGELPELNYRRRSVLVLDP